MMNVGLDHRDVDPQLDVVFDRGLNHRIIDGLTQRQSVGDPSDLCTARAVPRCWLRAW